MISTDHLAKLACVFLLLMIVPTSKANHTIPCDENNEFRCLSGECIALKFVCDNDDSDCRDGSDETDCFICGNGIHINWENRCDGFQDCSDDNLDETDCLGYSCHMNHFQCTSGECKRPDFRCDGYLHCKDQSDEFECSNHSCSSPSNTFQCKTSGECISLQYQCDGFNDCYDGSDELAYDCMDLTNPYEFLLEIRLRQYGVYSI